MRLSQPASFFPGVQKAVRLAAPGMAEGKRVRKKQVTGMREEIPPAFLTDFPKSHREILKIY